MAALAQRYAPPAWAFFPGLRNGAGFDAGRTADAVAMGVWPSRGLEIHGFEVKVSRGDLRRELADAAKADEVARYCDRWWLVVGDPKVLDVDEPIPATWGIMVPKGDGLRIHREAPLLPENMAVTKAGMRSFLAVIMKTMWGSTDTAKDRAAYAQGVNDGRAAARDEANKRHADHDKRTAEAVGRQNAAWIKFCHAAGGVQLSDFNAEDMGLALKAGLALRRPVERLRAASLSMKGECEQLEALAKVIEEKWSDDD